MSGEGGRGIVVIEEELRASGVYDSRLQPKQRQAGASPQLQHLCLHVQVGGYQYGGAASVRTSTYVLWRLRGRVWVMASYFVQPGHCIDSGVSRIISDDLTVASPSFCDLESFCTVLICSSTYDLH